MGAKLSEGDAVRFTDEHGGTQNGTYVRKEGDQVVVRLNSGEEASVDAAKVEAAQ